MRRSSPRAASVSPRVATQAALVLASLAWALGPAGAAESTPPVLTGPEIVKLDWNIRGMVVRDFDRDGRADIAVINNDRARIEMLLQREPGVATQSHTRRVTTNRWEPELEDARFEKRPLSTGIRVFCLAAGDLNGDGRVDLAYTGEPDAVTIRLQSPEGDWNEKRVLDLGAPSQYLTTVAITDYDGDRRDDLVVLLRRELVILGQTAAGELRPALRYALGDENCFSLQLADLNDDGRRDLVYLAPSRRDGLRVRLQLADGLLGPEVPYRIETSRTALELVRQPDATPIFAHVQHQTAMLSAFAFAPRARPTGSLGALKPRVYSLRAGEKNAPSYALGDVDGNGRLDVAVADADGAQLLVYFQVESGDLAEARAFPSLAEARALAAADWNEDGHAELFVVTAKEQTVGVASYTEEGRISYPQPLPISGRPLAADAGVLAPGETPVVAVAIEEGGKRRVDFVAWSESGPVIRRSVGLLGLRTDPRAVQLLDANQDQRLDLAVFVPFEPMRLLVQDAAGEFSDLTGTPGFRRGLVDNLDVSALTLADVDDDGNRDILVAGSGHSRVLRVDEAGVLQIADQFNAREPNADIIATFATDIDDDGVREVVLYDRRQEQLQVLRRNAQRVFEYADSVPVGRLDLIAARQADLNQDGKDDLFFLGKDRFWVIPTAAPDFTLDSIFTHETDLHQGRYDDLAAGDLDGDGASDFVMVDTRRNLIEVLLQRGDALESVLHFRVFEADPHVQNRGSQTPEPREVQVADVTGDGRTDLLVIAHDRLLIYPRE